MTHNLFSPSSASIWQHCLQSQLLKGEDTAGEAAKRGTLMHAALEARMRMKTDPPSPDGPVHADTTGMKELGEKDPDCLRQILEAENFLMANYRLRDWHYCIESSAQISIPTPLGCTPIGGTADFALIGRDPPVSFRTVTTPSIAVLDFKTGIIPVSPKKNPQLTIYLMGFLSSLFINLNKEGCAPVVKLQAGIIQPSANNIEVCDITYSELDDHFNQITKKLKEGDFGFYPGDHCKWCKAKNNCPRVKEASTLALDAVDENLISDKNKSELLTSAALIKKYIAEIEEEYLKRLEGGEEIPGFARVPGRQLKKLDEKEAAPFLRGALGGAAYTSPSLISYSKARDLLIQKDLMTDSKLTKKRAKERVCELLDQHLDLKRPIKYKLALDR